jgi:hypothetical protein
MNNFLFIYKRIVYIIFFIITMFTHCYLFIGIAINNFYFLWIGEVIFF